jgi:alpha-1,2-mannosyltransferase
MFFEYYEKKLKVIYPSNAVEELIPIEIHKKEKTVIFLSRLAPDKKVEKVLELAEKFSGFTFYIVGTTSPENHDYLKRVKKEIRNKKLINIEFVLNQPYSRVIKYLSMAEYYVFFAKNEHFGITTVEAILLGCIPFVHNSGGQKEIVTQDNLKFDYHNMVDKFNELLVINEVEKEVLKIGLCKKVQQFKEEVFINRMVKYII